MGEIVAAVGTCHTPYMFTRPPDENPQQLDQAGAAMQELGKVLDETKPDVILFFGADHVETFSVTLRARRSRSSPAAAPSPSSPAASTTCRSTARWPRTSSTSSSSTTASTWRIQKTPSSATRSRCRSNTSSASATSRSFRSSPTSTFRRCRRRRRCAALGKAIADIVKGRKERVAIIASGGMSHFPGTTKYLHPEFDFDRWLLSQFESRQHRRAART